MRHSISAAISSITFIILMAGVPAFAQAPPPAMPVFTPPPPTPNDTLISHSVDSAFHLTLKVYAPQALNVTADGDLLPFGQKLAFTKDAVGIWTGVTDPLAPGTYRYAFVIDGVRTLDPKNPDTSRSQPQSSSLLRIVGPGSEFEDTMTVPHGAVAEVYYPSTTFDTPRRMHIYTPPGYGVGNKSYPVLYLLHGGGDSDDSWSTVGRAGFILDNLIAAGKAKPMIVVMPAGHVPEASGNVRSASNSMSADPAQDRFTDDLLNNIMPYVEKNYRVSTSVQDRAIAGLSMGGVQTANIGLAHPELFSHIGIFSSGWFPDVRAQFEASRGAELDQAAKSLKLMWVAYGETDIARPNAEAMLQMFDRHHLAYRQERTPGGHVWSNWRTNLRDFAPLLFQ